MRKVRRSPTFDLRSEIQRKLTEDKAICLENQCQKIEEFDTMGKSKKMYDMTTSVKNDNTRPSQQACIKDEDGIVLEQKEDILNRWKKYGAQLFERPKEEESLVEEQIPPMSKNLHNSYQQLSML